MLLLGAYPTDHSCFIGTNLTRVTSCSLPRFPSLFRISKNIPATKDVEPLLEIDGDIRSFEVFLSSRTPVLTARDVEMFLPCTVNLDPKLREIIAGPYTHFMSLSTVTLALS